jgi:hypothetical protein
MLRPGPYAWAFFVQLCYESADDTRWVTVGFATSRQAALTHLGSYRAVRDEQGLAPTQTRVIGGEELRREAGEEGVLRAVEDLTQTAPGPS